MITKKYRLGNTTWEHDNSDDFPLWYKSDDPGITGNSRITEDTLKSMGAEVEDDLFPLMISKIIKDICSEKNNKTQIKKLEMSHNILPNNISVEEVRTIYQAIEVREKINEIIDYINK